MAQSQAPLEELPGDQFATKYRRLLNGSIKADFADITDQALVVLLEHQDKAFEYAGFWWSRTKPSQREQYGDGIFKNTPEERARFVASYKAKPTGGQTQLQPPPQAQSPASLKPTSEPAQRIMIMVPNLTEVVNYPSVKTNSDNGWEVETTLVIMRRR
jgi:hypothetical protein